MITRFRVKNYKSLVDVDIPLTPIHVIIGQNDTGKTSLLEAIRAFCRSAVPQTPIANAFEGNWQGTELVYFGANEPIVELSACLEDPQGIEHQSLEYGLRVRFVDSANRDCPLADEWIDNNSREKIDRWGGAYQSGLSGRFVPHCPPAEQQKLTSIADLIGSAFLYRFDARLMKLPAAYDENRVNVLDSDGFGLPTLLADILETDRRGYDKLIERFCVYFPEFTDIRLRTVRGLKRQFDNTGLPATGHQAGKGIFFVTRSDKEVRAQQASDGTILFLGFLALSYMPNPPKVLLIEEPETGVYPQSLRKIVGILKHLIEEDGDRPIPQIIFTTHSPYVLSEFEPEEVTLMSRVGDHVIARPLRDAPSIQERFPGFYLGELWYNLNEEELFQDGPAASHH